MDWTNQKGSAFDLNAGELTEINSEVLTNLVSEETLLRVSQKISQETHARINDYRKDKHLEEYKWDSYIQAGADLRGKEILTTPTSTRPNGEEGMDAPYDFGYPREKLIQMEAITSLASNSLKWLIQNGSREIFRLLLQNDPRFLLEDDSTESAVGVHIAETVDNYFMGAVYLAGKEKEQTITKIDRSQLVEAYNYSSDLIELEYSPYSWGKLMLAKAEAMEIYRKKETSQAEIDQAAKKLLRTIVDLSPYEQ
ncbi:hypothetical protein [Enterococcus xiangfangensis]|uniref:hypothetical protein n=1 Tax=Enterococcus xiangfangensis TaxID=1296537 RepID=UPI0010FA0B1F|nr:hypothetical protein [Enterococcus xiangfangensis]MBM7711021.1 hypothetical protein [Enterococcus xiangfangensis]NBK07803.1 hypothetical protein [Enterococcus asini]